MTPRQTPDGHLLAPHLAANRCRRPTRVVEVLRYGDARPRPVEFRRPCGG